MTRQWHSLATLPKIHDVIWCCIPHWEAPDTLGEPHPCVVREIERYDPLGQAIIHVTRGTSNLKKETREFQDLIVDKPGEMAICGLKRPTRFDLDDARNKIPCDWDNVFFPDPKPVG